MSAPWKVEQRDKEGDFMITRGDNEPLVFVRWRISGDDAKVQAHAVAARIQSALGFWDAPGECEACTHDVAHGESCFCPVSDWVGGHVCGK